ncbi:unnamed protein product, partial [Owenia fusiformis]
GNKTVTCHFHLQDTMGKHCWVLSSIGFVLAVLVQRTFGVAPIVTTDDFAVACGTEGPGNIYGPIEVTLTVPDAATVENYTVYVFTDSPSSDCEFNKDSTTTSIANPSVSFTSSFSYYWDAESLPGPSYPSEGVCGVEAVNSSHVTMKVMVVEGVLFTAEDKVFNIVCEYQPASTGIASVKVDNEPLESTDNIEATGTPNVLDRNYALTMHTDASGDTVASPIIIGTHVNLRVTMAGADGGEGADGDENAIRVDSCIATDDAVTNTVNLITNRCRDLSTEVIWKHNYNARDRIGFFTDNTGELSESPAFEMFAITGGNAKNIVSFTCDVEVCRDLADCQGDNCPSKRRKRDFLHLTGVDRYRRSSATTGHVFLSTSVMIHDGADGKDPQSVSSVASVSTHSLLALISGMVIGTIWSSMK